jgi:DNA processing protein
MTSTVSPDAASWLALNMVCDNWPAVRGQIARRTATPDDLSRLQRHGVPELERAIPGLGDKLAAVRQSAAFAQECERLEADWAQLITFADAAYPDLLRWLPDPPPVLYVRGEMLREDRLAIAVVGSRRPSRYGQLMARRFGAELTEYGFTVVSGLARGIDSLAHQGALQAGGRTVAVLGCGVNRVYPAEHRRLYEDICSQGAVVSEFAFDTKPDRWNFPRRNRIISGLSLGVLVVEASDRSGSLHTAHHAVEQGREVFAVPGRIDVESSRGTHRLIQGGAKLVTGIGDILDELPEAVRASALQQHASAQAATAEAPTPDLSPQESRVLGLLGAEESHIEAVIHASQLPAHVVASILATLELRGVVRQFPGKFFARS